MKLTVVGCSGSLPGPRSAASCYLVDAGSTRLVLDLGSGALCRLQSLTDLDAIDAVLLSHLHPDHVLDLCGLFVHRRYRPGPGPTARMTVHGPSGTAERIAAAYGTSVEQIAEQFDITSWDSGITVQVNDVRITVQRVSHPGEAYAVRLEHGGRSLTYSGDTGPCDSLTSLAAGADLFLCEAAFVHGRDITPDLHLTGRQAGECATSARVQRLLLTHVPPWNDADVALAEAILTFSGHIDVASPGLVVDV